MSDDRTRPTRGIAHVREWENRTTWPLFAGAVVMVALLTWVWVEGSSIAQSTGLASAGIALLWLWFLTDYVIRLVLAGHDRREFVRTRAFDLVTLLLPLLRPFLLLVYVWRLPVFQRGDSALQRTRYAILIALFALMYVYVCSYGVWLFERDAPGATIVNFGDAIWWGFTTIATVGYGDYVPITVPGRIIAVALMVGGVFVIGVVTATLISDLNDRIRAAVQAKHPTHDGD